MSDWSDSYKTAKGDMFSPYERRYAMENKSQNVTVLKKKKNKETKLGLRGIGKTGLTTRPITDLEKQSMCLLRGKGLNNEEIAEQLKRTPASVAGVFRELEKLTRAAGLNYSWREDLRDKSVRTLAVAVTDHSDIYKAGTLALNTLKGTGDLIGDGTTVNFATLMGQVPESQKSRYITLAPPDPNLITLQETSIEERKD